MTDMSSLSTRQFSELHLIPFRTPSKKLDMQVYWENYSFDML